MGSELDSVHDPMTPKAPIMGSKLSSQGPENVGAPVVTARIFDHSPKTKVVRFDDSPIFNRFRSPIPRKPVPWVLAGSSLGSSRQFELSIVNTGTTETPIWKVRITQSTLAGGTSADLGFSEGVLDLDPAVGVVYGHITLATGTGAVDAREIVLDSAMPSPSGLDFYVEIGTVWDDAGDWKCANSRYGPITADICGGYDDEYYVSFP